MIPARVLLTAFVIFSGCASVSRDGATLTFTRSNASSQPIIVRLRWAPATDPALYTPRGPLREVTVSEAGQTVSVPPEQIRTIEDIWPERLRLHSMSPGDYDLHLHYGVGQGALALVRIRNFRVADVRDIPTANVGR